MYLRNLEYRQPWVVAFERSEDAIKGPETLTNLERAFNFQISCTVIGMLQMLM